MPGYDLRESGSNSCLDINTDTTPAGAVANGCNNSDREEFVIEPGHPLPFDRNVTTVRYGGPGNYTLDGPTEGYSATFTQNDSESALFTMQPKHDFWGPATALDQRALHARLRAGASGGEGEMRPGSSRPHSPMGQSRETLRI